MKTTSVGWSAEAAAADYLAQNGYKILARNWRTRWCEIDIIAQKDEIVYFVEVKFRGDEKFGSGFDYIGPNKIRQLKFAVNFWNAQNNWEGDCRLVGAEVAGDNFQAIDLVEIY